MSKPRSFASTSTLLAGALLSVLGAGCDQDPTKVEPAPPTMAQVAGEYSAEGDFAAVAFLTTEGDLIVDWLAEGARFSIDLAPRGTTAGELYIPISDKVSAEEYFEPEDIARGYYQADLTGTWSLDGQIIRFDHAADTFVRDMDFLYNDGTLTGDETWSVRVQVVLSRR